MLTGIIRIAPHRGDHRVALRAAISLSVPLLLLWAMGRLDLAMYASFGGFAALYGRNDGYADRVRMQAAAGVTMVAAMFLGTSLSLLSAPALVRILVVALVAAGVAALAHVWQWHPPGGLFAVFAAGACASIPATPVSLVHAAVVGGSSAVFAVTLTAAIALLRIGVHWGRPVRTSRAAGRETLTQAVTVALGAALAGTAGLLLVGDHWYWAMVAAVAALGGVQLTARLVRGIQRLIGTGLGVLIAAGLLALGLPPLATIAVAVLCQVGAELYVGRNYGIAMVFVTPLALLMVALAVPADPARLLADRLLDTVIGVAVGTAVALVSAGMRRRVLRARARPATP